MMISCPRSVRKKLQTLSGSKLDMAQIRAIGDELRQYGLDDYHLPRVFAGLVARYELQVPAASNTPFVSQFWTQ